MIYCNSITRLVSTDLKLTPPQIFASLCTTLTRQPARLQAALIGDFVRLVARSCCRWMAEQLCSRAVNESGVRCLGQCVLLIIDPSCRTITGLVQSFGLFLCFQLHIWVAYGGNAENWLRKYDENEWDVKQRRAFPFDFVAWFWGKWTREDVGSTCSPMQLISY